MKIMFVCHGNICRSPMAEFILKKMVREQGLASDFEIHSSATSSEEIWNGRGNPVYPPVRDELARHGIDCGDKRARQLQKNDYDKYDLFVCMDDRNHRNMIHIFGEDKQKKIRKLMDYTSRPGEVADPWYSGDFSTAYRDIYEGCAALLKKLTLDQ